MKRLVAATLPLLALSLPAAADIRFTDIPDIFADPYQPEIAAPLDLDGDGLTDIEIHADWGIWAWVRPGCAIAKDAIYSVAKPAPFESSIGPDLLWYEGSLTMHNDNYAWDGVGFGARQFGKDEFLAVRIGPTESPRYAWVCVRIALFGDYQPMSPPSCQVRFVAFEDTPNTPISAGRFPLISDCNGNAIDDRQDIAYHAALDSNGNGIPDSCDPPAVYHVPEDFGTIQEAVSACRASGDEIIVGPGEYAEMIHTGARSIYIHSEAGAQRTTIRVPEDTGGFTPIEFDDMPAEPGKPLSRLEGFTLSNGQFGVRGYVHLRQCRILANSWGGVDIFNSRVESCLIAGNGFYGGDGGVGFVQDTQFVNCLLIGNSGESGIVYDFVTNRRSAFTNCVFIANNATVNFGRSALMQNSIMRGNTGYCNQEFSLNDHCSIDGANPLFVRPPSEGPDGLWGTPDDDYGDLRLREYSPFLNAGVNTPLPDWISTDAQGRPRIQAGTIDLGAFEGPACIGDLNIDGLVDDLDFIAFVNAYNAMILPEADSAADFNGDKQVDDADFVFFAAWYNRFLCP